jgi:methylmalonyl-CoA/ethylmalonyl-CoA epimerase
MSRALHHIGILVPDIAKAAQDFSRRHQYRIASAVYHDAVQTAHVQFLDGDPSGICLELVTPDSPNSKLTNALKRGGGLNHLCYFSDNIEEDCAQLRAVGCLILHQPTTATAFFPRRIAWLMGKDGIPIELLEKNPQAECNEGELE